MKSLVPVFLILTLLGISSPTAIKAQGNLPTDTRKIPLAMRLGAIEEEWQNRSEFERRRRSLDLNTAIQSPLTLKVGDKIEIRLFDGDVYIAKLNRFVIDLNGTFSLVGRIEGTEHGYFYLSTKNGISFGTIELVGERRKFSIAYNRPSGVHHLTEVDPSASDSLECAPPLIRRDDK